MAGTERRTGRPKLAPDEGRTARLPDIRVTAAERAHIEAQAAQAGVSVTEFVRAAALGRRIVARMADADEQALSALNKIGVNMNQIAHAAHLGKVLAGKLDATLSDLQAVMGRIGRDGS